MGPAAYARTDHRHGREAFGAPGASVVGETVAAGSATTLARSDHRHGREGFGTPVATGVANAAGSAPTAARSDHVHARGMRGVVAKRETNQAISPSSTFVSVLFTTNESITDAALHSTSSNTQRFVAPWTGWYLFTGVVQWPPSGSGNRIYTML
jgi:hypothetical protein